MNFGQFKEFADNPVSCRQLRMKYFGGVGCSIVSYKPFDFGADLDHDLNLGIFTTLGRMGPVL